jgi:hypothetical protein
MLMRPLLELLSLLCCYVVKCRFCIKVLSENSLSVIRTLCPSHSQGVVGSCLGRVYMILKALLEKNETFSVYRFTRLADGQDNFSFRMSRFKVFHGLMNFVDRITPVDHGF